MKYLQEYRQGFGRKELKVVLYLMFITCLLYTSDAADDYLEV